jgi:hypothetical protein
MDELTAIRQLLAEPPPPTPDVVTAARARLDRAARGSLDGAARGTGASRRRARGRAWWPAAVAGLAAAVAAAVITAQAIPSGARPQTGAHHAAAVLAVKELAYRAAAAAARQPAVQPGQWVFWQEKAVDHGCGNCPNSTFQVWTTANSQRAAFAGPHGTVVNLPPGPYDGQPYVSRMPHGQGQAAGSVMGTIPVSYRDLGSLPPSPQVLGRYLANLRFPHWQEWGSPGAREFQIIEEVLTSYLMPPRLTAELYTALGGVPGVTVDSHAVDVAGRHGIAFVSPRLPGGGAEEIILNPRTYHLMGHEDFLWGHPQMPSGIAILREALVSGPGARP